MGSGASAQLQEAFDKAKISQDVEAAAKWVRDNQAIAEDLEDKDTFQEFTEAAGLTRLQGKRLYGMKDEFLQEKPRRLTRSDSELLGIGLKWFLTSFSQEAVSRSHRTADAVWQLNFHELVHLVGIGKNGFGKGTLCPRDELPDSSIVDAVWENGHSKKADHFLSWCWGYVLRMVFDALEQFQRKLGESSAHLWWCFFQNNQYRIIEQKRLMSTEELEDIFGPRLKKVGQMVALMDKVEGANYTKRVWCIYETLMCQVNGTPMQALFPPSCQIEMQRLLGDGGIDRFRQAIAVDVQRATATSEQDERRIKQMIVEKSSFDSVNKQAETAIITACGDIFKEMLLNGSTTQERRCAESKEAERRRLEEEAAERQRKAVRRDKDVYFAMLAEQAELYDEMAEHMTNVINQGSALSAEERNLLSVAYKNSVGSRRAAWRIITKVQQEEIRKGHSNAGYAKEYCAKVEAEVQTICDTILSLLKEKLIPKADGVESKVFYQKMMGDSYRWICECRDGDQKKEAAESARGAYANAAEVARKDLAVWNPIRLGLALNYSVFMYEVLQNPEEGCKIARSAFEDAVFELDNVAEESYNNTTLIMQLLRDNLTLWTSDQEGQ